MTDLSTFEAFRDSDIAHSTLRALYAVLKCNENHYGNEPWRQRTETHHMTKAVTHLLASHHHGVNHLDNELPLNGGSPPTRKPHLWLALSRVAFAVTKQAQSGKYPDLLPGGIVIDTTEDEAKHE